MAWRLFRTYEEEFNWLGKEESMTPEEKLRIDNMSQYELCSMWRFAPVGDSLLQGDTGIYFATVLEKKGGFTSKISKDLARRKHNY